MAKNSTARALARGKGAGAGGTEPAFESRRWRRQRGGGPAAACGIGDRDALAFAQPGDHLDLDIARLAELYLARLGAAVSGNVADGEALPLEHRVDRDQQDA